MSTKRLKVTVLKIAVLISGGGRTLHNLIQRIDAGTLTNIEISLVISSTANAAGLNYANDANIPSKIISPEEYPDEQAYSEANFAAIRDADLNLVVMAGFMKYLAIPADFENRVINIHPGLIPSFCGKGFYGLHVHQAVLDYGAKVSGCTIHFVDNQYDHGPIIFQQVVAVKDDDTAKCLAERVFEAECEAYPHVIQLIANGQVQIDGRLVKINSLG